MFFSIGTNVLIIIKEAIKLPKLDDKALFDYFMSLEGKVYRDMPTRTTSRIILNDCYYFIKKHHGVGWLEILKNIMTLKLPVISAQNEYIAIEMLKKANIDSTPVVAVGVYGSNPARKKSFLLTKDLGEIISLEELTQKWSACKPSRMLKKSLIRRVANIVRNMHQNKVIHRDLYICHLCLKKNQIHDFESPLVVMDLHRAEISPFLIEKKKRKDLAALLFSSLHLSLTNRDILTFLTTYFDCSIKDLAEKKSELAWINQRAIALDEKYKRKIKAGYKL